MTRTVHNLACVACLALVGIATGCGDDKVDPSELEAEIKKDLAASAGVEPKAIECPGGVEIRKGKAFECTGTAPNGETFRIDVKLTNAEGGFSAVVPPEQFE